MSFDDFEVYQNNLLPNLEVEITDGGQPVDPAGATSVTVVGYMNGTQKFSRLATTAVPGLVTMGWVAGDTDTIGPMQIFVDIVWTGKTLTIEADNLVQVLRRP